MRDKKTNMTLIKKIATFLLLISFFLPMAKSCSKVEIPNTTNKPLFSLIDETPETKYIWDVLAPHTPLPTQILLLSLVFFWPLPFFCLSSPRRRLFVYLRIGAELLFGLLGGYLYILLTAFWGAIMIGGYLYLLATALYLGTTLVELWQNILAHVRAEKILKASLP